MNDSVIMVFTARGFDSLMNDGGSQAWVVNDRRASQCPYLICVQNRISGESHLDRWGDSTAPHLQAFFIGKISDIVTSPEWDGAKPKRWLIKVREYAKISLPNMWFGSRNPVAYSSLKELGIKIEDLHFNPMPLLPGEIASKGITIQQAKELLSQAYDISADNIEITLRA
jgi:hypothetical protein